MNFVLTDFMVCTMKTGLNAGPHSAVSRCLTREPEILGSVLSPATLSFLLLLIQEGQLSVTGKSMCTKDWLTVKKVLTCHWKTCG